MDMSNREQSQAAPASLTADPPVDNSITHKPRSTGGPSQPLASIAINDLQMEILVIDIPTLTKMENYRVS